MTGHEPSTGTKLWIMNNYLSRGLFLDFLYDRKTPAACQTPSHPLRHVMQALLSPQDLSGHCYVICFISKCYLYFPACIVRLVDELPVINFGVVQYWPFQICNIHSGISNQPVSGVPLDQHSSDFAFFFFSKNTYFLGIFLVRYRPTSRDVGLMHHHLSVQNGLV